MGEALVEEEVALELDRLVTVRWLFLGGLALAVILGSLLFAGAFETWKVAGVGAAVLYYNLVLALYHRYLRYHPSRDPGAGRIEAGLQAGLDLLALAFLAHFTGGAESPLLLLYPVYAVQANLLFHGREGWLVGAAAGLFVAALVVLEASGALAHHELFGSGTDGRYRDPSFLAASLGTFLFAMAGSLAVTSALRRGAERREAARELTRPVSGEVAARALAGASAAANGPTPSQCDLAAAIARELSDPAQFVHTNLSVIEEALADALPLLDAAHQGRPSLRLARLDYPFFRSQIPVLMKDLSAGASRIAVLARDLEACLRGDDGRMVDKFDLNQAVKASLRLVRGPLSHLEVEEDLDPHLPRLRGNPGQLRQAIANTLSGAAKAFGPAGHLLVRTRAEDGATRVRLSIAGEVAAVSENAQGGSTESGPAAPLAPEVTYAIIRGHQGRVEVETRIGQGTTFHYLLPAAKAPEVTETTSRPPRREPEIVIPSRS
jgi:signal transduction histidine kinase